MNFVYEVYKVNFVVVIQMLCITHSCLRLEEWVLIIYMMLGGSRTSTPTLSKFNQALFHPFFCSTCMQLFQARLSLGSVKLKVTMLKGNNTVNSGLADTPLLRTKFRSPYIEV